MQRSSASIASLSGALAKAQAKLVNPEKSLTATIRLNNATEQSFRYAPLASGLEIIRKTLSEHEIAAIQTTAIDQSARTVMLTTTLAHASGEWIASDWPVCPMSDLASPRRMGAALTYARRYALFTLVGIAGEDDIDAPDLNDPPNAKATSGAADSGTSDAGALRDRTRLHGPARRQPALTALESATVRDACIGEIAALASLNDGIAWAKHALPRKNTLTAADAGLVEQAFSARMRQIERLAPLFETDAVGEITMANGHEEGRKIDKSALTFGEPRRLRNRDHLRFVAKQPCLVCGRKPCDPHHIRFAQPTALGRKVSDEFAVPLCRIHHRVLHRRGNEHAFWRDAGIDPMQVARRLWGETRGTPNAQVVNGATPATNDSDAPAPTLATPPFDGEAHPR